MRQIVSMSSCCLVTDDLHVNVILGERVTNSNECNNWSFVGHSFEAIEKDISTINVDLYTGILHRNATVFELAAF